MSDYDRGAGAEMPRPPQEEVKLVALRDQPYLPLYVMDFLSDEKLRECSAESVGVYIMLMCVMHKQEEYGTIQLRERDRQSESVTADFARKLTKHLPFPTEVIDRAIQELLDEEVLNIDGNKLYQKRMVKDGDVSQKRSAAVNTRYKGRKSGETAQETGGKAEIAPAENAAPAPAEGPENTPKKRGRPKKPETPKVQYAEFVSMTEDEYKKLVEKYGETKTKRAIEILDNYKGSSGKKYASDYRTILNWVMQRVEEEIAKGGSGGGGTGADRGTSTPPTDWSNWKPSTGFRGG